MTKCEERRLGIVQKEVTRLKNASQILNKLIQIIAKLLALIKFFLNSISSVLVSLNLPAAIEDMANGKLPKSVADKSAEVRRLGGYQHLDRLVEDLPTMMQRCRCILDEVSHASVCLFKR